MVEGENYEIVSQKDLDELRKEIAQMRKNPFGESNKGKNLAESMDRLEITINKLVKILEDAQEDIVKEYQESKPAEKLGQLLEQNETIARALLTINENIKDTQLQLKKLTDTTPPVTSPPVSSPNPSPTLQSLTGQSISQTNPLMPQQPTSIPQGFVQTSFGPQPLPSLQQSTTGPLPSSPPPIMGSQDGMQSFGPPPLNPRPSFNQAPLDMQLPPLNDLPPFNPGPSVQPPQKKKVLGFI